MALHLTYTTSTTLRVEISAGNYFRKAKKMHFAGIYFHELILVFCADFFVLC